MGKIAKDIARGVALVLICAFLALVIGRIFFREYISNDAYFIFIRWPVWVIGGFLLPILLLRIVFWRRGRGAQHDRGL